MAFLDTLKEVAGKATELAKEAGKTISEKASDVVEVTQLKTQIASENSAIAQAKKELADYFVGKLEAGEINDEGALAIYGKITEALGKIKEFEAQIEATKEKVEEVKEEVSEACEKACEEVCEEAKPATKVCPLCGAEQPIDAKVCEICGYEFQ